MDERHTVRQTNLWRFRAPVSPRSGARSLTYLAQPSSQPEGRVCSLGKMLRANKHSKTVLTPHLDPEIDPFVGNTPSRGFPQRQFSPLDLHEGESNITQCRVDLGRRRQPGPHAQSARAARAACAEPNAAVQSYMTMFVKRFWAC
jgi:hypothetical protein